MTRKDRTTADLRRALAEHLRQASRRRVRVGGPVDAAAAYVAACVAAEAPVAVVAPDPRSALDAQADIETLAPDLDACVLPPLPAAEDPVLERQALSERLSVLDRLERSEAGRFVVLPAGVLLEPPLPGGGRTAAALDLAVGARVDPLDLAERLASGGYTRTELVARPGEFSRRGDILDVHAYGEESPFRIEWFDDRVESLRRFDPETQRSTGRLDEIAIRLLEGDEGDEATVIADRIPRRHLLVVLDRARAVGALEEAACRLETPRDVVRRVRRRLETAPGLETVPERVDDDETHFDLETTSVRHVGAGLEEIPATLGRLRERCRRIVVFSPTEAEAGRVRRLIEERAGDPPGVEVRVGTLSRGFAWPRLRVAFLTHLELLGRPGSRRPPTSPARGPVRPLRELLEVQPGDYVVHRTHGVCRFREIARMRREGGEEEFLVLEFEGGTLFYLPASKIDLIERYVGAGGAPRLDRIGGASWANKKKRVREALEEVAEELLETHANRLVRPGPPHPFDDPLITEFEASFPHEETPDQLRAMRDIHADLSGRRPMDRLLCGDVGFGKTELAVRAAFRVVLGGKQVAVLVPTTLLAEQHARTFEERLASYPVRVECLSRFRSSKRQREILEGLETGSVDIVVGTHRLLSRDVRFRDLGLLVVDEEQRFGVRAKETLKRLRRAVDVLTLTATPIPRTLHMALVGLRDVSSLETPPLGRRPIHTEIRRFDRGFVAQAIRRELARGGQVFFVHNRVRSLGRIERIVRETVPEAEVAVAHGQMRESELERSTRRFAEGEADVLVCTNIIESGLDLPRANTILIDRPDLFGLADLHQLRGRVGRTDRQAFCYLLVPEAPLPHSTLRRLKAIEELSHLGAGYRLALEDLEIRGAGNLLGSAQHGHIAAVGYDLYVQLLRAAVARVSGRKPPPEPVETDVELGVDAFLPADYVTDPAQRMEILRRFGAVEGPSYEEMIAELRDRFGRLPPPARRLAAVFALKRRLREVGVRRLLATSDDHLVVEPFDVGLMERSGRFPGEEIVWPTHKAAHWVLPPEARTVEGRFAHVLRHLLPEATSEGAAPSPARAAGPGEW